MDTGRQHRMMAVGKVRRILVHRESGASLRRLDQHFVLQSRRSKLSSLEMVDWFIEMNNFSNKDRPYEINRRAFTFFAMKKKQQ
ncbi:hypothetical protein [Paenibacillus sp. N3.4]|uniref:hypothetical protein n=1 Tax=Paenibacillus sp. N3.4 TaxID=2603222 RepID=UPI00164FAFC9|nr:hypothetical protein [Paenibacillus sp. N3.4]